MDDREGGHNDVQSGRLSPPVTGALDLPDRQLMVVDDEEAVRVRVRAILEPEGWTVTEASGGARALALLRDPPFPDLLLLDLMMPGLDGLAVLTELRRTRGIWDLPIVVLSTGGSLSTKLAGTLGADGSITKPFDPTTLRSRCASLARPSRPAQLSSSA